MLENFIYAKQKSLFEEKLNNGEVLDEAIVFIEDTKEIWNHGTYFDGSKVDLSNIEASILNIIDSYATKAEIPTKVSQLENDANYIQDDVIPENGLYIYDTDGRFTLPENWNTANNSKAVGVAILTDDCRFVVAKEDAKSSYVYWGGYGTDISTLTNYTSNTDAATDFDGVNNTAKIIAAIGNSNDGYRDGTAAGDCASYTFPNGKTGYLGAAGEWKLAHSYKDELNLALELIGGTKMTEGGYWTSTECRSGDAWFQDFGSYGVLDAGSKEFDEYRIYVRAFLSIEQPKPLKERVSELESSVSELLSNVYTKEEIDEMFILSKYEFVDLGLPSGLKWAAWNVGATKPEEYGLYFAWGETEGYSGITDTKKFNWSDYKLCGGSSSTLTKYNTKSSYGTVDNIKTLELVDDAAYTSDKTCRMPTKSDFEELTANTISVWETLNGVNGRRFTSKTNGNSIFVPAAGNCFNGSVRNVGSNGFLWSSSLNDSVPSYDWYLYFYSDLMNMGNSYRCSGLAVRAVQEANTNTKFNPSETVSKVNNIESQIGDINTILESIING